MLPGSATASGLSPLRELLEGLSYGGNGVETIRLLYGPHGELPKGSDGTYGTSIPLSKALDPAQDVIVAYAQGEKLGQIMASRSYDHPGIHRSV